MSDNNDPSKSGDHLHPARDDDPTLADTLQSLHDMEPVNSFDLAEEGVMEEMMNFGENDIDQDTLANLAALSKFTDDGADAQGDVDFSMFAEGFGMQGETEGEQEGEQEGGQEDTQEVELVGEPEGREAGTAAEVEDTEVPTDIIEEELFNEGLPTAGAEQAEADVQDQEDAGETQAQDELKDPPESQQPQEPPQTAPTDPPLQLDLSPQLDPPPQLDQTPQLDLPPQLDPLDIPEPPPLSPPRSPTRPPTLEPRDELRNVNEIGQESAYGTNAEPPREDEEEDHDEDEEFTGMDPKYVYEDGRLKRKRNRTTLSCTECHRRKQQCDRNIPCSRCIKRGVASMCRIDMPALPEKKKRKLVRDVPVDYELGVRVQALESLIRSGSTLDQSSASTAAMETILHATRAAESGSLDASSALAQLTDAMSGSGVGAMTQDAQSSLLMDVLHQLSTASTTKAPEEPKSGKKDVWSSIPTARPDTSSRILEAFEADQAVGKITLALPGFRDDNGEIFVPPTVKYAEKQMRIESVLAEEALPSWGDQAFLNEGLKFAYGEGYKHTSAIQAISLTGALRVAGTFLSRFPTRGRHMYLPSPSTDEDTKTLRESGLDIRSYRFLDRRTGAVDFDALRDDLTAAPEHSAVLLFVGGSIPSGTDLTTEQWTSVITLLQQRRLIPLVVMAFQGLTSGDPAKDAEPVRLMAREGLPVVLCQTFDALMGLHGDSPSILSVLTQSDESKDQVDSQLRAIARSLYLHPSPWGAYVGRLILSDPKLHPAWLAEIKAMAARLRSVREKLYDLLANKFKTPGTWDHIKRSTGMYCTTLLSPIVNDALTSKRHVHILPHGSFSLGCLNAVKIESLARSIDSVVLTAQREAEEAQAAQLAMQLALEAAREAAAREEAEAEAQAARDEDRRILEMDLQSAIDAQRMEEEDEQRREEEERGLEEAVRKAAERAETARQAEAILASITAAGF